MNKNIKLTTQILSSLILMGYSFSSFSMQTEDDSSSMTNELNESSGDLRLPSLKVRKVPEKEAKKRVNQAVIKRKGKKESSGVIPSNMFGKNSPQSEETADSRRELHQKNIMEKLFDGDLSQKEIEELNFSDPEMKAQMRVFMDTVTDEEVIDELLGLEREEMLSFKKNQSEVFQGKEKDLKSYFKDIRKYYEEKNIMEQLFDGDLSQKKIEKLNFHDPKVKKQVEVFMDTVTDGEIVDELVKLENDGVLVFKQNKSKICQGKEKELKTYFKKKREYYVGE